MRQRGLNDSMDVTSDLRSMLKVRGWAEILHRASRRLSQSVKSLLRFVESPPLSSRSVPKDRCGWIVG